MTEPKIHQSLNPISGIHLKAHQCSLTLPNFGKIFESNKSPSGTVYAKPTQMRFGFTRRFGFGHENTLQNYHEGQKPTYTIPNDRGVILPVSFVGVGR